MLVEVKCLRCGVIFNPSDERDMDEQGRYEHYECKGFDTVILGFWGTESWGGSKLGDQGVYRA